MTSHRPWSLTILTLTILVVAAHLLATGPMRDSWWGVHQFAFLPIGWLVGALALLGGLQALWLSGVAGRLLRGGDDDPSAEPLWRQIGRLAALALGGGVLFWLARTRHLLLGDASVIAVDVPRGGSFLPREPLADWLQQRFYILGKGLFGRGDGPTTDAAGFDLVAQQSVALGSVVAGVLMLPVAWLLAGELVPSRAGWCRWRLPLFLALIGQGYLLLFCGYVEHYAFPTLALALYLWLSLRALRTGGTLLLPAAALLLAVGFHLSAAVMAPSFLVLVVIRLLDQATRKRAIVELAASLGLVASALVLAGVLTSGYDLLGTLAEVARMALTRSQEGDAGYLLSTRHGRDFLNEQALIGPLGLFLFLPAVIVAARRRDHRWWFLGVAGLAYLAVSWLAGDSNLGYPRNWDLLSPGSLVFTAAGLALFLDRGDDDRGSTRTLAVLWLAVGLSWFHTAPWIALNTSFERSFARYKHLPSAGGLTETNVGRWYLMLGERDEGRRWLRAALKEAPSNNNAWYLLGRSLENEGDAARAAEAYGRAVALRPDKVGYRESLVRSLVAADRWSDAVAAGRPLATDPGAGPETLVWYGAALHASGNPTGAAAVLERVRSQTSAGDPARLALGRFFRYHGDLMLTEESWSPAAESFRAALAWNPAERDNWLSLTYALGESGDGRGAVMAARDALDRYPDWPEMLTNLGLLLYRLGRPADARPIIERSLALDPQQAQAAQLRALLDR